jgi:hypothetical protein
MTALLRDASAVRIAIREVGITAASPVEARRLVDALPAALERAFARLRAGAPAIAQPRPRPADRVAVMIARAVLRRLENGQ